VVGAVVGRVGLVEGNEPVGLPLHRNQTHHL
jgi:hypothetical protein